MSKFFGHLKTVHIHRKEVRKMCFKMGIPWQGITHDLSKYSIKELKICKYYTGKKSPHQTCRDEIGYSPSWICHYHRNKHHWEYWIDTNHLNEFVPIKMPYKYVIESFCDMVGAGKAYSVGKGVEWKHTDTWDYYEAKCKNRRVVHPSSDFLLAKLLWNLHELGEEKFISWYNTNKKAIEEAYNSDMLQILDDFSDIANHH